MTRVTPPSPSLEGLTGGDGWTVEVECDCLVCVTRVLYAMETNLVYVGVVCVCVCVGV